MSHQQTTETASQKQYTGLMKWVYGLLVASGIATMIFSNNFMLGVSNLGIALVFDPFDQTVTWKNRPVYQKAWLFAHVVLVLLLFVYGFLFSK